METASTDRNTAFFRFEDLRIYHKALEYSSWVHKATKSIDATQDNVGIKFNEAARAVAQHIAEGSARNKSQFIYYLKMAKSAVRECLVLTSAVRKYGYLNERQDEESRNYLMELTKMIGALISSLQRGPGGTREVDDTDDELELPNSHMGHNNY